MIAVDTNVLLRLTLMDNETQLAQATALIEDALKSRRGVFINAVVLCEYVWTLARTYRATRQEQSEAVRQYLDRPPYRLFDDTIVRNALELFENSKADFADCLIGAMNEAVPVKKTYSFDISASALKMFGLPPVLRRS
jgi:predicted nucleic-acid-binding protein